MSDFFTRSAVDATVNMDGRTIDVFVVPYNRAQKVTDQWGTYDETFAPGAFGNVGARANRVKVLRDHTETRAVGRCRSLAPNRPDGLRASLYLSRTPLGDESLELAKDGILDVSVGFSAMNSVEGNEFVPGKHAIWRSVYLREISLVPFPAYDDARVLAVRNAEMAGYVMDQINEIAETGPAPTPRLDEIRSWLLQYRSGA